MFKGRKVEVSRFKGLGEMLPAQLRSTTMDPASRSLLRVVLTEPESVNGSADRPRPPGWSEELMGRRPELRFSFIQENAKFVRDLDV